MSSAAVDDIPVKEQEPKLLQDAEPAALIKPTKIIEDVEISDPDAKRVTSLFKAVFSLTKSAVGLGTVYLPGVYASLGWGLGTAMNVSFALLCAISHHFLARLSANTDVSDYYVLGRMAFGKAGETVSIIATLMYLYGALIAYIHYAAVNIAPGLHLLTKVDFGKSTPMYILKAVLSGTLLAVCLILRDLSKLSPMAIIGMGCILLIVGTVLWDAIWNYKDNDGVNEKIAEKISEPIVAFSSKGIFTSIAKFLFAYANQITTVGLVPTMINPTPKRRHQLIGYSLVFATLIYVTIGNAGYYRYGANVGNILEASNTKPYMFAKFCIGLVLILSFPLLQDPTRGALNQLLPGDAAKASQLRLSLISIGLIAVAALIAMFAADSVENLMDFLAVVSGAFICFILPPAFFYRLRYKYPVSRTERVCMWVSGAVGVVCLICGGWVKGLVLYNDIAKAFKKADIATAVASAGPQVSA